MNKCIVTGRDNCSKGKAQCAMGVEKRDLLQIVGSGRVSFREKERPVGIETQNFLSAEWGGEHSRWRE